MSVKLLQPKPGLREGLFDSGLKCCHCGKDPGHKKVNVWNGFLDGDTGQYVGWCCHKRHYELKKTTEYKHLYSEFPVVIA